MSRFIIFILFLFIVCGPAGAVPAHAGERAPTEAQVKVAMIYNLAKFVEWPANKLSDPMAPFVLCYLGSSPLKDELVPLQGKTIKNHVVTVKEARNLDDIGECHLLFLGEGFSDRMPIITEKARQKGILTVSDMPGFAVKGGMVELLVSEGKVRFKINHVSVKDAQLMISAQVLKLSLAVIE